MLRRISALHLPRKSVEPLAGTCERSCSSNNAVTFGAIFSPQLDIIIDMIGGQDFRGGWIYPRPDRRQRRSLQRSLRRPERLCRGGRMKRSFSTRGIARIPTAKQARKNWCYCFAVFEATIVFGPGGSNPEPVWRPGCESRLPVGANGSSRTCPRSPSLPGSGGRNCVTSCPSAPKYSPNFGRTMPWTAFAGIRIASAWVFGSVYSFARTKCSGIRHWRRLVSAFYLCVSILAAATHVSAEPPPTDTPLSPAPIPDFVPADWLSATSTAYASIKGDASGVVLQSAATLAGVGLPRLGIRLDASTTGLVTVGGAWLIRDQFVAPIPPTRECDHRPILTRQPSEDTRKTTPTADERIDGEWAAIIKAAKTNLVMKMADGRSLIKSIRIAEESQTMKPRRSRRHSRTIRE
jgi:hypothetical protein